MSGSDSEECYADIYRNGEKSLVSFSYENGGSGDEAASNTAVFHLIVGEQVWIQTERCDWFFGFLLTAYSRWKLWFNNMTAYLVVTSVGSGVDTDRDMGLVLWIYLHRILLLEIVNI